MSEQRTFNYTCITDGCITSVDVKITKAIKDEDKPEPCGFCNEPMKCIGYATNITHIGRQDGYS